ncbi:MAG: metal ABC transporter permease [Verrucomicrobiota bacterium]|jgi:zinc transport system permease protein|nr:metal ABC transporter permease [Verrucomicrobiota bacterium]
MSLFWDALHMGFMQRAMLAGTFVAVSCACLGLFMVLRRQAMIGDGLAHFTFAAVGLGLFLGAAPLLLALPLVMAASLLILHVPERTGLLGDSAIGMISALGLAGGVLLAGLGQGIHVDLLGYLFGDILAVSRMETILAILASFFVVGLIVLNYHDLFALTFDPVLAKISGVRTERLMRLMAVLVAVTVVLGVRVVGTLLISGLLVFPAATALQVARRFRTALVLAALIGAASVLLGITVAFLLDLPAGAAIILLNAVFFGLALVIRRIGA